MTDRLRFTYHPSIEQDKDREHNILVTRWPDRVNVSSRYKQDYEGCPFNTQLRPTSFADGSDAYHAAPTSDELLIEIATYQPTHGVTEYIGFLSRTTDDTPSKNGVREVKWIPQGHGRPIPAADAARDLGPSRHGLLSNVYSAVDRWSIKEESSRDLGLLTNNVLGEYLGTMCHDTTQLYDSVNGDGRRDVQPPCDAYDGVKPRHKGLVSDVGQESLHGRKAWHGRGRAEDRHR